MLTIQIPSHLFQAINGYGFTSRGQESGSVFSAAVCKILTISAEKSCFS